LALLEDGILVHGVAHPTLPAKANILGVGVSVTDYAEVARCVIDAALAKRRLLVSACAVHSVMEAIDDPVFAAVLNEFDIVTPDGQPVRWGMSWTRQAQLRERVYGPTLTLHVCEAAASAGLPIFLYGSRTETMQLMASRLRERMPGLVIAGMRAGRFRPLSEAEQAEDAAEILASGARIVFVGMGCPRQDWWIFHMRERIALPMLAVGAAFDFHAGQLAQAPAFLQDAGLEWLFRLSREPKRLWRRYLTRTPRYLPLIAQQALGTRSYPRRTDLAAALQRPCPG
jgi:N-acetylglucosaminyldiphosphoundecaprenol N-acetyl-beta-D-mannosaminyltransferase